MGDDRAGETLADRVLRRLESRFVFVVGKGGVGKTTTAAALALRAADRGAPTRLISTDPAHSLGDVLDEERLEDEAGSVRDEVCGVPLTVESFDAAGYAEEWIRRAREPVTELFELGTYLDADEVRSFLDLSLPGLDEVMGALRLAELSGGPEERVVVDTAPAGHALRLLDAGAVLGSWVRALRAMSQKATAVAAGLTRRDVRLAADSFVDELDGGVRAFESEVLAGACFLTVTRPDRVVRERTERLVRSLRERDLRVCGRISVGRAHRTDRAEGTEGDDRHGAGDAAEASGPRFVVPLQPDPTGCGGLRRWGTAEEDAPDAHGGAARTSLGCDGSRGSAGAALPAEEGPPSALRRLLGRRVAFLAGKGGVGKSTCAAACALVAAEERPTVLVSTDPGGSLSAILEREVTREGVEVVPGLSARQLDADAELQRFLHRARAEVERIVEGLGAGREAALDREVAASLLELAPPGIDEIFALVVVMELIEEGDRGVIVDAAPTGHFLRLIGMPEVALEWIRALMRILLEYRSVAGLDEAAERLLDLARRVKRLRTLLVDPDRTAALLVTLDEPVVAAESRRLHERMAAARMTPVAWIHNRSPGNGSGASAPPSGAVSRFVAPRLAEPPRGVGALRAFASRWQPVT